MSPERNEDFLLEPPDESVTRLRRGRMLWAPGRVQVAEGELCERDIAGTPPYGTRWRPVAEEAHVS